MKVKIIGVSKESKSGVSKKSGKPYCGKFISYTYKREDMHGVKAEDLFYSDDMANASKYTPSVGDLCDIVYGRGGFIEEIKFIGKGELT